MPPKMQQVPVKVVGTTSISMMSLEALSGFDDPALAQEVQDEAAKIGIANQLGGFERVKLRKDLMTDRCQQAYFRSPHGGFDTDPAKRGSGSGQPPMVVEMDMAQLSASIKGIIAAYDQAMGQLEALADGPMKVLREQQSEFRSDEAKKAWAQLDEGMAQLMSGQDEAAAKSAAESSALPKAATPHHTDPEISSTSAAAAATSVVAAKGADDDAASEHTSEGDKDVAQRYGYRPFRNPENGNDDDDDDDDEDEGDPRDRGYQCLLGDGDEEDDGGDDQKEKGENKPLTRAAYDDDDEAGNDDAPKKAD